MKLAPLETDVFGGAICMVEDVCRAYGPPGDLPRAEQPRTLPGKFVLISSFSEGTNESFVFSSPDTFISPSLGRPDACGLCVRASGPGPDTRGPGRGSASSRSAGRGTGRSGTRCAGTGAGSAPFRGRASVR
jgi:hypothetical protein